MAETQTQWKKHNPWQYPAHKFKNWWQSAYSYREQIMWSQS